MKLVSYGCKNYKPFSHEAHIEVRPLTLIFGKNSSGKSAILRLLRIILHSCASRTYSEFPLSVGDLSYGTTFSDLVHNRLPHGTTTFSAHFTDDLSDTKISATLQNIVPHGKENATESPIVSDFSLISASSVRLTWEPSHAKIPIYRECGPVNFSGLLPADQNSLSNEVWQAVQATREKVQLFEATVSHLGPLRKSISRIYASQAAPLGFDGAGAPNKLSKDAVLLEQVANWYQSNLDGWRLSIENGGIAFQCTLVRGNAKINLADAGQGMQQVLPIITQQFSQQLSDENFIHLIEQPELHLHTGVFVCSPN